jgi:RNA-directed DNA polymerase
MTNTLFHKLSRHTEYYNISNEFDRLYKLSTKQYKFTKLYDLIFSSKNIRLAYRNIKRNKGSKTPGIDKIHIGHLQGKTLIKFLGQINKMAENFKPSKVRRVWIPKPNGKKRPLGIPTLKDRLFQQCIKQILEPICEAGFHKHSYGFRPCRSSKHALARASHLINIGKLHYVVDIDIKDFFDNINQGKLLKQFWTLGIRDKRILSILSKILKAEVIGEGIPSKGTPQGGILSPLFSNVCLNELDWWLSSQWETFPTRQKYSFNNTARRALKRSQLKEFFLVRYADDFKIFCKDRQTAAKIFTATTKWLKDRLHLDISTEKSMITNLRKKGSPFLGILLRARKIGRKIVCHSRVLPKAIENIKIQLKNLVKGIQRNPKAEIVKQFNTALLGFQQYYNCATHCTIDFSWLGYILERTIHNRLNKLISLEGQTSKLFKKKYTRKSTTKFICSIPMYPIADIRHQSPMCFSQDNTPYTEEGRKKIHKELNAEIKKSLESISINPSLDQTIEFNDNRISRWVAAKGKCSITGEFLGNNFHCHHKIPTSKGGSDAYDNLVILTPDIHKLIHATNPENISNILNIYELSSKQLKSLNNLRELAGNESIK